MHALLVDIRPLRRSVEYRRLWIGTVASGTGSRMTSVAVPIQVYDITHSSFAVGLLGLALAIPLITVGLLGGALADAVDRRTLALVTTILGAVVSLLFALQAVLSLHLLWPLYALTVAQSSLTGLDGPARRAFIPRLVPREQLASAAALAFLSFHLSNVVGPLLAGAIIAASGLPLAYLIDAASFLVSIYSVLRLPSMPIAGDQGRPDVRSVLEGLRHVRQVPVLIGILLADLNATIFGMPFALFPALAFTHFRGGAQAVGLLYAAPAAGGLVAALLSGPLSRIRRQGLAIVLSIVLWGASITLFGLSRSLWLALSLLVFAGAADVINGVFRITILQVNTPDKLQGRVGSVGLVVGAGGAQLGDVEAGIVAQLTSPVVSAVTGGLACMLGVVLVAIAVPSLAGYDAHRRE